MTKDEVLYHMDNYINHLVGMEASTNDFTLKGQFDTARIYLSGVRETIDELWEDEKEEK